MATNGSRKRNAFGLLMTKPRKSSFVVCPAGCGRHISACNLNHHLDQCLHQSSANVTAIVSQGSPHLTKPTEQVIALNDTETIVEEETQSISIELDLQTEGKVETIPRETTAPSSLNRRSSSTHLDDNLDSEPEPKPKAAKISTPLDQRKKDSCESGLFNIMMDSAKMKFAEPEVVRQSLFLDAKGTFHLLCDGNAPATPIHWTKEVQLKEKGNHETNKTLIDLTLCSAIPQYPNEQPHRWVLKHSRLSVPVLKSILQKSIRRKRPLPSVRVAMELMDKAPEELLRRLPIISLEDSTLHPDLPLLVGLMIFSSKDFQIPTFLLRRVLQIVYEIASCSYKDSLCAAEELEKPKLSDTDNLLVWAMLARARYGGMTGDVKMLQDFASEWRTRFSGNFPPVSIEGVRSWLTLPSDIHSVAREKVAALVPQQLDSLKFHDITLEGIDFHCTPIIDHLEGDSALFDLSHDLLLLSSEKPPDVRHRKSWVLNVWKSCMWQYSAGVNRRRPLLRHQTSLAEPASSKIWSELLASKVAAFQKKYVQGRLS